MNECTFVNSSIIIEENLLDTCLNTPYLTQQVCGWFISIKSHLFVWVYDVVFKIKAPKQSSSSNNTIH